MLSMKKISPQNSLGRNIHALLTLFFAFVLSLPLVAATINLEESGKGANYSLERINSDFTLFSGPATAPTVLSAKPGVGSAHISFNEPANNGGFPIINYEYELDGSGTWTALSPAAKSEAVTIEGLTNCTIYSVKLRAITSYGAGAASQAIGVTPKDGEKEGITWTGKTAA